MEHGGVVIALGNAAPLNQFSNISAVVTLVINALVERFGCTALQIWVLGLLPHPLDDAHQVELLKGQNKSLFLSVRALVHKRGYPLQFIPAYKWLLKWVKHPDGTFEVQVDGIYYVEGTNDLNESGQAHLHLLLARELQLRTIKYKWQGMLVVEHKKVQHKVYKQEEE